MSIGSRIKEKREQLGLTQTELAEMIGVTKGAIGNYETDANSPKASIMFKVFESLQCDANYIFQDMLPPTAEKLSPDEAELLSLYRLLNDTGQDMLLKSAHMYADTADMKKANKTEEEENAASA